MIYSSRMRGMPDVLPFDRKKSDHALSWCGYLAKKHTRTPKLQMSCNALNVWAAAFLPTTQHSIDIYSLILWLASPPLPRSKKTQNINPILGELIHSSLYVLSMICFHCLDFLVDVLNFTLIKQQVRVAQWLSKRPQTGRHLRRPGHAIPDVVLNVGIIIILRMRLSIHK